MDANQKTVPETTDSWPWGKIVKHVLVRGSFMPNPKGSPKAGKKEIAVRAIFIAIFGAVAFNLFAGGKSLPDCDDADTQELIGRIVNNGPAANTTNIRFVSIKDIAEQGYNKSKKIRSCQGLVVTTAGENQVQYSIRWSDEDNRVFRVQLGTGGESVPVCDGAEIKELIGKIVNDQPRAKIANIRFVSVKDIAEQGYNKSEDIRSCQGVLVTTAGESKVQYSVSWQDKTKGLFYVQLNTR